MYEHRLIWWSLSLLKTDHINSCDTWLRNSWRRVDVDGVQTMQRWWLVTCGECLCVVMVGKCGTVWRLWCGPSLPSPAIPYPAQPGPWRALQGSYSVTGHQQLASFLPSHWLTAHYLLGHTPLLSLHLLKATNCHFKIILFFQQSFLNLNLPKMYYCLQFRP